MTPGRLKPATSGAARAGRARGKQFVTLFKISLQAEKQQLKLLFLLGFAKIEPGN
ncbi:hypothetical protein [Halobacillus sp. B23F22_1]|uniref:hypothetical protein n=1 Tax=Halobacillus sp. B23F22_1 TaxID=3459514 RepID=UPI00373E68E1